MENLDVNILIKTFTEKVNQMSNDLIVKDAIITQLASELEKLNNQSAVDQPVEEKKTKTVAKDDEFK